MDANASVHSAQTLIERVIGPGAAHKWRLEEMRAATAEKTTDLACLYCPICTKLANSIALN